MLVLVVAVTGGQCLRMYPPCVSFMLLVVVLCSQGRLLRLIYVLHSTMLYLVDAGSVNHAHGLTSVLVLSF